MKTPPARARATAALVVLAAVTAIAVAGCHGTSSQNAAVVNSENTGVETTMDNNQPAPVFDHSDIRATGIEIEAIEALGENTTSFAVGNNGSTLIWSCPSLGEPFHADDEITNPSQVDPDTNPGKPDSTAAVLPNMDPNGIYPGPNIGTYVLCVDSQGIPYAHYTEAYVDVVSGPATWNPKGPNHIVMTGAPSMPSCTAETVKGKAATVCTK